MSKDADHALTILMHFLHLCTVVALRDQATVTFLLKWNIIVPTPCHPACILRAVRCSSLVSGHSQLPVKVWAGPAHSI